MGFWDKKLAPAPAAPPQRYGPDVLPRGMGSDPASMQRAVNHYVSQLPGQVYGPQTPAPTAVSAGQQWQPNTNDPTKVSEVLPIWHWGGNPNGGAGEQIGNCPHCGSSNFFSRRTGSVVNTNSGQMVSPTPECWECGYPREQGALGQAHVEGPAMAARQGQSPIPAPPGSVGTLVR